jgi:CDP-glucose 4,6-dehydratase
MHFLITGHTGFKGSWISLLLSHLGHEVSGFSLEPALGGAFDTAKLDSVFKHHVLGDIRDKSALLNALQTVKPDVLIHMAAQPLVIESYRDPVGTFETNVSGTLNVLEACKATSSVKTVLVVTTDKVYRDNGLGQYEEEDPLGGFDPYSSSKSMADLLAQAYGNLDVGFSVCVARAGNVIGRGDVSANRLIPDILRSATGSTDLLIRNSGAVRPWQHVLDCVYGYLLAVQYLVSHSTPGNGAISLNFGPEPGGYKTVSEVVETADRLLGGLRVQIEPSTVKETSFLTLDSTKARNLLGWKDKLSFETAIAWSLEAFDEELTLSRMQSQVQRFLSL